MGAVYIYTPCIACRCNNERRQSTKYITLHVELCSSIITKRSIAHTNKHSCPLLPSARASPTRRPVADVVALPLTSSPPPRSSPRLQLRIGLLKPLCNRQQQPRLVRRGPVPIPSTGTHPMQPPLVQRHFNNRLRGDAAGGGSSSTSSDAHAALCRRVDHHPRGTPLHHSQRC